MRILCYGDSNTWGYVPNINGYSKDAIMKHYDEKDCWWYHLKQDNDVFINGSCGRCVCHENKWLSNRNADKTINKDLQLFGDLDLIIVQLGTNDCKSEYDASPFYITERLEKLLNKMKNITNAQILFISPAIIREDNKITQKYYVGAQKKSADLDNLYKLMAQRNGFIFVSGKDLEVGEDGEHLTLKGHRVLGERIALIVKEINIKMEMENC